MRDETRSISQVINLTNKMREEGVTESEICESKSQEWVRAAAQRWQQIDNKRKDFAEQADRFLENKNTILADDSLTDAQKQQQINAALESFDDNERRRLRALELMRLEAQETTNN